MCLVLLQQKTVLYQIIFQNSMDEYNKIIEEKDYCDESELLINEYSNNKPVDLNDQLAFIQKWVMQDNQNALIITDEAEAGTKTLLCSFLKQSKKQNPQWLHIAHFVSITPIYSNILYKIMIQLRNHFKIQQKVDLNEQKLRRYFKYWLQIVSQFLQKQYLGYKRNEIPKVVIILEGVDGCVDLKGNFVQHKFWLPSHIPSNVKLIITTRANSHSIQNSLALHHYMSEERRQKIIKKCCQKTYNLTEKYRKQKLYHLILIEKMVRARPQFKVSGNNFEEILKKYITSVVNNNLSEEQIKSLLYTLTLTRKGLKYKWIQRIINVSHQKWQAFCKHFDFFIVTSSNYYTICNPKAKNLIQMLVDPHKEKVKAYRNSIIRAIKNQSLHLRGLQQIVYQLLLTQNFSELKEVISRVQNFIMLYTPFSKELLCQCWVRLEQLQQFDPVFQYNKAIQAYASHYYPKEEELYKIIFQISIFFKEYSEFQNAKTPKFRHPLIKGEMGHLQEIGIYDELKLLEIVGKCKIYKMKPLENKLDKSLAKLNSKDKSFNKKKTNDKSPIKRQSKKKNKIEVSKASIAIEDKQPKKIQKQTTKQDASEAGRPSTTQLSSSECQALQPFNLQELNVGIATNQQKFRQFFAQQMKEYLQNYFVPLKKSIYKDRQLAFESQQSDNQQDSCKIKEDKQFKVDIQKLKDSLILKKYKEYLEEDYHKNGEQVSYYYYKQWIWLQFPWICQTVKHIYSKMISQCLPGSIHFMSPTKEFTLIKEVLRITRAAKETKMGIYTEQKIEILPIKNPQFRLQKLRINQQKQSSYCSTRRSKLQLQSTKNYKIDLSKIQVQIIKEKQQELKLLEKTNGNKNLLKSQISMPSLNMFVTQNEVGESRLFPAIKKSNFGSGEFYIKRGEKQNNNQNSRDYTMMVRKFNEIKHDNQMLIQKIEEKRRLQMQMVDKNQLENQKINNNIDQLQEKHVNLQKNLKNQQELSKKLEIILKICDLNKMYGSQTDYLSTYLDNLKFMIGVEDNRTKKIKESIKQTIENGKSHIKMLKQKRRQLKILKDQRIGLNNLATDSTNPQGINLQFEQIEKQLKEMNRAIKTKSKKTKLKENHYLSQEDYQLLEEQLGFRYGDSNNEIKIEEFADKYQKLNVLKLKKIDILAQCRALQKRIAQKKLDQKFLEGKDKGKIQLGGKLVQKKKQLTQLKNRNQLLQNALQSLTVPQQ